MPATYEDLAVDIDRIARDTARDYPDIDWEDVRQALALFVLENGNSIKMEEDGGNPRWILRRVAQTFCKDMRTQHMVLSPQYAYRPSEVKLILESAFLDAPSSAFVPDDARSPLSKTFNLYDPNGNFSVESVDPFHEADFIEVSSDIKAALMRLKPDLRQAIFDRYVLMIVPTNNSWERKKLNKAINELTRKLNWYRGYDNTKRRTTSNAGARAMIAHNYEM